ncbi:hypothetical protein [Streptomyces sp. NBC_00932]|uniref:hypothetical protein n=1 Tax=Streptomyces sp. NBC_00932 TaxID=2903690 RepID=UPI00386FC880|nr:hypothetical protein OG221_18145 [Streptomyces sp. NBC_00932]
MREDADQEWLYDDAMDGIDEIPSRGSRHRAADLGIAPMPVGPWFTPFNDRRYVHPYAADAPAAEMK